MTVQLAEARQPARYLAADGVRRPTRGLEVKTPTYSYMRVITDSGEQLLFDNTASLGTTPQTQSYANYLIQALTFTSAEKMQVIETFGEDYAFFFGQRPIQAQLTGGLINSNDFPWSSEMWRNYQNLLRGTKLAERGARMYLYYDGVLLEGLPFSYSPSAASEQPYLVPFSMSILVTSLDVLYDPTTAYPRRFQTVDLDLPDAYSQLLARSQAESASLTAQYRGSQINQQNRARFEREYAATKVLDGLGILLAAATQDPHSALSLQSISNLDQFLEYGGPPARPWVQVAARTLPLRGRVSNNIDEWVLPAVQALVNPTDAEIVTTDDARAAEAVGAHGDGPQTTSGAIEETGTPMSTTLMEGSDEGGGPPTGLGSQLRSADSSIPPFGSSAIQGVSMA